MSPIQEFEDYLKQGIANERTPDPALARSLRKESEETIEVIQEYIEKIGVHDKNANHIIKNSYDALMARVRAEMALTGYTTSGPGAHEAEVAFLSKKGFNNHDVEFANQLRYFRNRILYDGKSFDAAYARKVLAFTDKILKKLNGKQQ